MMFPSAKEATKRAFTVAAGTRPSVNQLRENPGDSEVPGHTFLGGPANVGRVPSVQNRQGRTIRR